MKDYPTGDSCENNPAQQQRGENGTPPHQRIDAAATATGGGGGLGGIVSSSAGSSVVPRRATGRMYDATQTSQLYQQLQQGGLTARRFQYDGVSTPVTGTGYRNSMGGSSELGFIQTMAHQQEVLVKAVLDQNRAMMEQNNSLATTFKSVTDNLQQLSLTNVALVGELKEMRRDQTESTKLFLSEVKGEKEEVRIEKEEMRRERTQLRREMDDIRREREKLIKDEAEHRYNLKLAQDQQNSNSQRGQLLPQPVMNQYQQTPHTAGAFWPVTHNTAMGYGNYVTPPPPGVAQSYGHHPGYYQHQQTSTYQGPAPGLTAMRHMLENQYAEEPSLSADEVAAYTRQILTQKQINNESQLTPTIQQIPSLAVGSGSGNESTVGILGNSFNPVATSSQNLPPEGSKETEIRQTFGTPVTTAGDQSREETTGNMFGQNLASNSLQSFSALNQQSCAFGGTATGFPGISAKVFGDSPEKAGERRTISESEGANDSTYEPNVTFEPIVPLPELIEVQTGEEDEEVLFAERAKLFRYIRELKEFKERGIGDLKILKHNETGKIRIVMRREQILKLCANHALTADMTVTPMAKTDRAFVWNCQDFAEGELTTETLAAKFKTPEQADKFKKAFEEGVKEAGKRKSSPQKPKEEQMKSDRNEESTQKGFGDLFKPKTGSWECKACLLNNEAEKKNCVACGCDREGKPTGGGTFGASGIFGAPVVSSSSSQFSFGLGKTDSLSVKKGDTGKIEAVKTCEPEKKTEGKSVGFGGFSFKLPPAKPTPVQKKPTDEQVDRKETSFGTPISGEDKEEKKTGNIFQSFTFKLPGSSPSPRKEPSKKEPEITLNFGAPADASDKVGQKADTSGSGIVFGQMIGGDTSFSSLSQSAASGNVFGKSDAFRGFPGSGAQVFGKSPERTKKESESGGEEEHFEPNVEFKPVVALPDLVEVNTGEEEEDILFGERAKLFRYNSGTNEFKERGIGDLKILKHMETGKIRILMRREQVLKLCANHTLTADMKLAPMAKSDKAFVWNCQDFSDGELTPETLAAKFKTPEQAERFRKAFEAGAKEAGERKSTPQKPKEETGLRLKEVQGFGDQFKEKKGTWTCESCMVRNEPTATVCVCCNTGKDGKQTGGSIFGGSTSIFGKSAALDSGTGMGFGLKKSESVQKPPLFGLSASEKTEEKPITQFGTSKEDDHVEVVSETGVSWEQEMRAEELQLPRNFFSYENKEPCTGCVGCQPEEDIDKILGVLHRLGDTREETKTEEQSLWECKATLQRKNEKTPNVLGVIKVVVDNSAGGYRLHFETSDGAIEVDQLISQNLTVHSGEEKKRATASWKMHGGDGSEEIRLVFSSPSTRNEFLQHFNTGVEIARLGALDDSSRSIVFDPNQDVEAFKALMMRTHLSKDEE